MTLALRLTTHRGARVLVAIQDASYRRALAKELDRDGIEPLTAATGEAALSLARTGAVGAAAIDAPFLDAGVLAALGDAPLVVLGLAGDEALPPTTFAALPRGTDERLAYFAVVKALELAELRARALYAETRLGTEQGKIVTVSKAMRKVIAQAKRVESAPLNVLVTGEAGTGKELLARIAVGSGDVPIADLSLASAPDAAIASVTTDGVRGPLIVLHAERLGADGQARLLAAIRAGAGGRVVSTADGKLREMALQGAFDRRLYQALSTALIEVPPLRARRDDIGMLALHFLKAAIPPDRTASIGHAAMRALRAHAWPENIPELRAAMQHASIVMRGDVIVPGDLPFVETRYERHAFAGRAYAEARTEAVSQFEREYVGELLGRTSRNYAAAARLAGMDRANFRRLAKRVEEEGVVPALSKLRES